MNKDEQSPDSGKGSDNGNSNGGHGSDKTFTIIVNTRDKQWNDKDITFRQVVELAFPNPDFGEQVLYTITYSKGEDKKPKGTLADGESVHVKNGMIFDVERSDKS